MNVDNFREMYTAELQELRSVETLPKMADMASHPELKQAILAHLDETRLQLARLDEVLCRHGVDRREHVDQAMQAILKEAEKWAHMVSDQDLRDAGLIASAQRVEHYEIAVYGSLATWPKQLGLLEDLQALHAILEDEKLSILAKRVVNPDALAT